MIEKQGTQQITSYYTPNHSGTADWQTHTFDFKTNIETDQNALTVLQNDASVQAVYEQDTSQWGIVLYDNYSYQVENNLVLEEAGIYAIRLEGNDYVVSYYNPTTDQSQSYTVAKEEPIEEEEPIEVEEFTSIVYETYISGSGWQEAVKNGETSGTENQSKQLESIRIRLEDQEYDGSIQYQTHSQDKGWTEWKADGQESGRDKRLEAIRIKLDGEIAEHYDVYYRVHSKDYGWLDWTKNGQEAGTEGLSKRLEAIEIQLVEKGSAAPGQTKKPLIKKDKQAVIGSKLNQFINKIIDQVKKWFGGWF